MLKAKDQIGRLEPLVADCQAHVAMTGEADGLRACRDALGGYFAHVKVGLTDIAVPVEQLAALDLPAARVFITENEINGLAFPETAGGIVLFKLGYALDLLAQVAWLGERDIHYWGDIDTHGFAMLDRLRVRFPHARSLLMDRATLMAHQNLWGREDAPHTGALPHLDQQEMALYDELRRNRLGDRVRLEQERIPFSWLRQALPE